MATEETKDSYKYVPGFFNYIESGATASAKVVVDVLRSALHPKSVLDVGCGRGAWLSVWKDAGTEVLGVDGDYVERDSLLIEPGEFLAKDISRPFDLSRQFDMVQCLEVAEHVEEENGVTLVQNLAAHGNVILFSAAVPGQGGENHVNEKPLEYWREKFASCGLVPFDYVRPLVKNDKRVEPWYRYNTILYVRRSLIATLPRQVAATAVAEGDRIRDYSPPVWRIRKAVLRILPVGIVTMLARVKHAILIRFRSR
jgi:SAM-dependent methyltransferase